MTVAPLDQGSLETRYAVALAARETRLAGTVADLSLWLETEARGRYPGVHATFGLGGSAAVRLRIASAFGTAIDAAGIGESLFVYIPARRTAVRAAAADPPVRSRRTALYGERIASATWPVPAAAWRAAQAVDSLHVARWVEDGDTLEVAVGASGLPRAVRLARPGMSDLRVAYSAYGDHEGTGWPLRFEVVDGDGRMRVTVRVRRLGRSAGTDAARWRPDVPHDANIVLPEELMRWIEEEIGS